MVSIKVAQIFFILCRSATAKELPKAISCFGLKVDSKKRSSVRQMRALKIVRLHQSAITHLSIQENYIVTGGADGYVRFYDHRIGLVSWFEELHAGINREPSYENAIIKGKAPT